MYPATLTFTLPRFKWLTARRIPLLAIPLHGRRQRRRHRALDRNASLHSGNNAGYHGLHGESRRQVVIENDNLRLTFSNQAKPVYKREWFFDAPYCCFGRDPSSRQQVIASWREHTISGRTAPFSAHRSIDRCSSQPSLSVATGSTNKSKGRELRGTGAASLSSSFFAALSTSQFAI